MLFTSLALLALPATLGFSDKALHERSRSRARGAHGNAIKEKSVAKRDSYNGRATFYDVGLGACGWWNVASDYIVAQNSAQFGSSYPSPNCGKSITISYNGVQVSATIADECPTCDYGSLDLSRGLFDRFASEDLGQFQMTWWYNDGSGSSPTTTTTSTWVAPTSTYTPPTSTYTPPTSTYTPPTSTSTYVAPTSTTEASSVTTTSTVASISTTSLSASLTASASVSIPVVSANGTVLPLAVTSNSNSTASPTGSSGSTDSSPNASNDVALGNLVMFNQAVLSLGNIVVVGAGGK